MSTVEFADIMDNLSGAYRDDRYSSEKTLKTWYRYFGKYDAGVFAEVLDEWIKNEPKSPQISDLMRKCGISQRKADQKKAHDALDVFKGTDEDREAHPFEDGWRVDDDNKWIQV